MKNTQTQKEKLLIKILLNYTHYTIFPVNSIWNIGNFISESETQKKLKVEIQKLKLIV